jgi:hypothetical protein
MLLDFLLRLPALEWVAAAGSAEMDVTDCNTKLRSYNRVLNSACWRPPAPRLTTACVGAGGSRARLVDLRPVKVASPSTILLAPPIGTSNRSCVSLLALTDPVPEEPSRLEPAASEAAVRRMVISPG